MSADAAARFCYCGRCVFECDTALGLFQACEVSSTLHCNEMRIISWITCWSLMLFTGQQGLASKQQAAIIMPILIHSRATIMAGYKESIIKLFAYDVQDKICYVQLIVQL